jgi:hypothetical protein
MKIRSSVAFAIFLSVPQFALSAPKVWKLVVILPFIETRQEVTTVPSGWLASTGASPNRIAGITVFDGRPEQKASLAPGSEEKQKGGGKLFVTWQLAPLSTEGAWIAVSYSSTSVMLAKSLPKDATELRVTYDTSVTVDGMHEIARVEYR